MEENRSFQSSPNHSKSSLHKPEKTQKHRLHWKWLWYRRWRRTYLNARWSQYPKQLRGCRHGRRQINTQIELESFRTCLTFIITKSTTERLDKTFYSSSLSPWRNPPWRKGRLGRERADGRWQRLFLHQKYGLGTRVCSPRLWEEPHRFQVLKDGRTKKCCTQYDISS